MKKQCITCGKSKSLINFYPAANNATGYKGQCKICYNKAINERRERKANPYAQPVKHKVEMIYNTFWY